MESAPPGFSDRKKNKKKIVNCEANENVKVEENTKTVDCGRPLQVGHRAHDRLLLIFFSGMKSVLLSGKLFHFGGTE